MTKTPQTLSKRAEREAAARPIDWARAGLLIANMSSPADVADLLWMQTTVFVGTSPNLRSGASMSDARRRLASWPDGLDAIYEVFKPSQKWLREVLNAVVVDGYRAVRTYGPEIAERCQKMTLHGRPRFEDGHLVDDVRVYTDPKDVISPAVGYIAALFLDERHDFGTRLRQCLYVDDDGNPCGRFFLLRTDAGPGSPSPYCNARHREAARKQSQRDRAKRYRSKSKNKRTRKKRTKR